LHASFVKVQTLASELLAAICFLSVNDGHKAVLAAMSDFRVAFDEPFRFETLIATLLLPELSSDAESDEESTYGHENDGVWEARTAAMTLVNAITNCPESLEERIMLREELGRRGLNEMIVVSIFSLHTERLRLISTGFKIRQTTRRPTNSAGCVHGRKVRR
jgi:hypothetical protein